MAVFTNIVFMLVLVAVVTVESRMVFGNKIAAERIQRCRTKCVNKFVFEDKNNVAESDDQCEGNQRCYMCWDYCSWLNEEKKMIVKAMCGDEVCTDGCKYACRFYRFLPKLNDYIIIRFGAV